MKNTKKALTAVAALAAASVATTALASLQQTNPIPTSTFPAELINFSAFSFEATGSSNHLGQGIHFNPGEQFLTTRWVETDPGSGQRYTSEIEEHVAIKITDIAAREGGNELYVAGINGAGKSKILRFTYTPQAGRVHITSKNSPLPIGTPMPAHVATQEIEGGTYITPGFPNFGHAPASRSDIYTGSATVGVIRQIVADPDGRYLLFVTLEDNLHPIAELYRINLLDDTITKIDDENSLAGLRHVREMVALQHINGERIISLSSFGGGWEPGNASKYIMLRDANNNGLFNNKDVLTMAQWEAAEYMDPYSWDRTHFFVGSF